MFNKLFATLKSLIPATKGGQPAATVARDYRPLRLELQFFADPPGDDPKGDPKGDPNGNPPDPDNDDLTLADLLKTNPKINAEYKERVEKAVNKRFKNFDFDPEEARIALREKKERQENGEDKQAADDQRVVTLTKTNETLAQRLKEKSVEAFAAEKGFNPKLMTRLAKDQISKLEFDDAFSLDTEELDELANSLREEFPEVFTVTEVTDPGTDDLPPPAPKKGGRYNPGDPKTNNPNPGKIDDAAAVAERLARLSKNKRIQ